MTQQIAIIGGGISGLATAHRLIELREKNNKDFKIALFEASSRFGGVIETEHKDGFLLEKGPDSFISEKPAALALSKRLGLEDEIISTRQENRRSFVVRNGKLLPVPPGFYLIAPTDIFEFLKSPLFTLKGKFRILSEIGVPIKYADQDESIGAFVRRRFGSEALERVGQAMLAGIYTGDPDYLSLMATLPRFKELEKRYGSVIRGLGIQAKEKKSALALASGPRYGLFLSYKKGMQTLVDGLVRRLAHEELQKNFSVRNIRFNYETREWILTGPDNEERIFDGGICLALSAAQSAQLLKDVSPDLARLMEGIQSESVMTINLAYKTEQISHPLNGFGYVSPAVEKRCAFACTFVDKKYEGRAPYGHSLLRAFAGGFYGREQWKREDAEIIADAQKNLEELLGIHGKPLFSSLQRYPKSMVQYGIGHLNLVASIRQESQKLDKFTMTGAALSGIGIPDCIRDAETQAESLYANL